MVDQASSPPSNDEENEERIVAIDAATMGASPDKTFKVTRQPAKPAQRPATTPGRMRQEVKKASDGGCGFKLPIPDFHVTQHGGAGKTSVVITPRAIRHSQGGKTFSKGIALQEDHQSPKTA